MMIFIQKITRVYVKDTRQQSIFPMTPTIPTVLTSLLFLQQQRTIAAVNFLVLVISLTTMPRQKKQQSRDRLWRVLI